MSAELEPIQSGPWVELTNARQALATNRDLDWIKHILDVAVAAKEYARARKLGSEFQDYAQEMINRAERRLGEVLVDTPKAPSGWIARQSSSADEEPHVSPRQQAGKKVSARSQRLADLPPDIFEANITKPITRLDRIARDRQAEQRRVAEAQAAVVAQPETTRVDLRLGDFREVLADLADLSDQAHGVDAIITDPPYPAEYLPLLDDLAEFAHEVLKPDGVLVVLMGQSHLPEVYRRLDGYRPYRWTGCYYTPGAGYVAHARNVQTNWKPLLVYGEGPRFADVVQTEGSDAGAKSLHKWGQDYSAFHTIVERLTKPWQTVCDPFMGSGTTLLAARALGRHVIGAEIDPVAFGTAQERLNVEQ